MGAQGWEADEGPAIIVAPRSRKSTFLSQVEPVEPALVHHIHHEGWPTGERLGRVSWRCGRGSRPRPGERGAGGQNGGCGKMPLRASTAPPPSYALLGQALKPLRSEDASRDLHTHVKDRPSDPYSLRAPTNETHLTGQVHGRLPHLADDEHGGLPHLAGAKSPAPSRAAAPTGRRGGRSPNEDGATCTISARPASCGAAATCGGG